MRRSRSAPVLLILFALACVAGCGSGGSGFPIPPEPSTSPAQSPTFTPPFATPATPVTTDVASTPGPSSGEEALLAVQYSAYTELPGGTTVLRREDGRWRQITLPVSTKDVYLVGTAFSSPSVAWAFGSLGTSEEDRQVCLYRSDDAGRTWVDVSSLVDVGVNRSARSMIFSSPEDGFLVAPRAFTLPTQEPLADSTLMTRDGGRSFAPAGGCLELRLCAGQAECLVPRGSVGAAPGAERYCEPVPNSDPLVNDNYIYAFDTRLDGRGVVCGDREQRPYCQYTTDGGTPERRSCAPTTAAGRGVGSVRRCATPASLACRGAPRSRTADSRSTVDGDLRAAAPRYAAPRLPPRLSAAPHSFARPVRAPREADRDGRRFKRAVSRERSHRTRGGPHTSAPFLARGDRQVTAGTRSRLGAA